MSSQTVGVVQSEAPPDLSHHLSSEARERLPNTMKTFIRSQLNAPQVISLANGNPQAELYPLTQVDFHVPSISTLNSVSSLIEGSAPTRILSTFNGTGQSTIDLAVAMQYGTGLGLSTLIEQLTHMNELLHPNAKTCSVILTLGNADAVTKMYRLLGSPGDTFLVEEYSFCGLTNAPLAQGVKWQPIKIDENGLIPHDMENVLSTWDEATRGRRPHVLYCIPTGQNPTGATLSLERRREIYAIAQRYDIIILEDDPYYFFQFDRDGPPITNRTVAEVTPEVISAFLGGLIPSFLSLDVDGRVVRIDSVSKTIAPNMRLGWITCNPLFLRKLEVLIDNSTQHPGGLSQSLMAEILSPTGWGIDGYLRWLWGLRYEYERRRNFFFEIFQHEIGDYGFASTTPPIVGMFFWVKINVACHPRFVQTYPVPRTGPKTNAAELVDELYQSCLSNGLLIMPGVVFAMQPTDKFIAERVASEDHILDRPFFRLTFVGRDDTIKKGLIIFGQTLKQFFDNEVEDIM